MLVLVALGLAALRALSVNYYFGIQKKTYESKKTTLSFQYPGRWKEVNPTALSLIEGMDLSFMTQNSEIILADAVKAGGASNFFMVESLQPQYMSDWNTFKSDFQNGLTAQISRMQAAGSPSGLQFTTPTFADITIGEDKGFSVSYHISKDDKVLAIQGVVLPHESQTFLFQLATPNLKTASAQMKDIMDTVKL